MNNVREKGLLSQSNLHTRKSGISQSDVVDPLVVLDDIDTLFGPAIGAGQHEGDVLSALQCDTLAVSAVKAILA